ncbi:hypothetical protein GUJ93_ZPchr0013g33846 [Zizania palustris]|uniref:Uncharacterized protein n=1 Tax=Zizania palustris TaxID=103762 RepID=A0A8J5WTE6_ZIZPA|nr:hypothetical protein GUJ93_ZPchr0013g33846 [Zizania palustris]
MNATFTPMTAMLYLRHTNKLLLVLATFASAFERGLVWNVRPHVSFAAALAAPASGRIAPMVLACPSTSLRLYLCRRWDSLRHHRGLASPPPPPGLAPPPPTGYTAAGGSLRHRLHSAATLK